MKEFTAIGENGNETAFQYKILEDSYEGKKEITFLVYEIPENPNEYFEYTFKFLDDRTLKGEQVSHHGFPQFSKKGLPEKIIEIASEAFDCDVESSPFKYPMAGNFLVLASQKAWERVLKSNSRCQVDEERNVYVLKRRGEPGK